jgi:hypothetical protein
MVGSHYKNFNYIFYFHPDMNVIEDLEDVWLKRTSKLNNILICKKFNITATQRGGVNEIYTNI